MSEQRAMTILKIDWCEVTFTDEEGRRTTVFKQGDGRLKCQSPWCKSRNHFKCAHVQFVQAQHVVWAPIPLRTGEEIEILTY